MKPLNSVNDFVIRFANVNGTGSWSANLLFAKSIFRMGIPVSPKNIFPSNIQGLPTWYEVRVSEKGYIGTRGNDVDIMVCINPQSMAKDVNAVVPGGYFLYDSTKKLHKKFIRDDINYIGIPLTEICNREYEDARLRQLFKNIIYVGALAALVDIDFDVMKNLVADQFKGKEKLIPANHNALDLGYNYAKTHFKCPIGIKVKSSNKTKNKILIDGNQCLALGAIYGGATIAAWYPITPSTSMVDSYKKHAEKLRVNEVGENNFAVVQAEDELAAMGMVLGATWMGARAFTATSGPGVSLMSEFLGLGYFAEIPAVLFNIQRVGPSTGMPTRTQQGDIISSAYASHGDTKHVLLFPSTPKDCFDMAADAFDIADQLQTPVIVMSDLDLSMNDNLSEPLEWDDKRKYNRGKVLTESDLEEMRERYGRYLDKDGDGVGYRTYPGTHPTKGSYFTRGSSHNEYAAYTESSDDYVACMRRLEKKWETAKTIVPKPAIQKEKGATSGVVFFGTSEHSTREALDMLSDAGTKLNSLHLKAFPFTEEFLSYLEDNDEIFVIEQNRDAQLKTLIMSECGADSKRLISVLGFSGTPITAHEIYDQISSHLNINAANKKTEAA